LVKGVQRAKPFAGVWGVPKNLIFFAAAGGVSMRSKRIDFDRILTFLWVGDRKRQSQ